MSEGDTKGFVVAMGWVKLLNGFYQLSKLNISVLFSYNLAYKILILSRIAFTFLP